jgi:hypothetical protein
VRRPPVVVFFSLFGGNGCASTDAAMPSLLRFLVVLAMLAGLTYGGMYALARYYDPKPREITISIPPDKFAKQR